MMIIYKLKIGIAPDPAQHKAFVIMQQHSRAP